MSNILITGTSGFLGGAVYNSLAHKHNVYPFGHRQFNVIRNGEDFNKKHIIKNVKPDIIINFGWGGGSDSKYLDSIEQFDNIKTCIDLFNFGIDVGVKRFIQIGSSWQYFETFGYNNYGFCKFLAKEILKKMAITSNIKMESITPWWIYGPNDKENRFIPKIINFCLKNEPISLHPAQNLVDYLFIEDFVSAVALIVEKNDGQVSHNLCSGHGYKTQNIVEKIKLLTNSKSIITYDKEYPAGFNMEWIGNNSKIRKLGWTEKVSLEEGLIKTIKWHKTK